MFAVARARFRPGEEGTEVERATDVPGENRSLALSQGMLSPLMHNRGRSNEGKSKWVGISGTGDGEGDGGSRSQAQRRVARAIRAAHTLYCTHLASKKVAAETAARPLDLTSRLSRSALFRLLPRFTIRRHRRSPSAAAEGAAGGAGGDVVLCCRKGLPACPSGHGAPKVQLQVHVPGTRTLLRILKCKRPCSGW